MRLTKQTSYAIRILTHCALASDKQVRSGDIARLDGITEYNVAKIVPMLVRAGFVTATRGRAGGLKLARPPAEISLGEVLRVTEATYVEAECVGGTSLACGIKRAAPINRVLGQALEAFIGVLDKHTLADLIGSRPGEAISSATSPGRKASPSLANA
jgi:Rrf2 family protein